MLFIFTTDVMLFFAHPVTLVLITLARINDVRYDKKSNNALLKSTYCLIHTFQLIVDNTP